MAELDKNDVNKDKDVEIPDTLPVLPVRDIVVFPYMIIPLFVGREISIKAIEHALSSNRMILLLTQKDLSVEAPVTADLYSVGTVGMIMRMLKLPDGRVKILVQGLSKARVKKFTQTGLFSLLKSKRSRRSSLKPFPSRKRPRSGPLRSSSTRRFLTVKRSFPISWW